MLMTKSQEKRETKNFYRLVIENSGVFFNHFAMCKPKITSELSGSAKTTTKRPTLHHHYDS